MRYAAGQFLYNGRKNVLWGAGEKGIETLFCLAAIGIPIEMFCDSDINKHNTCLYNKSVVSPESVLRKSIRYNIIVAVEKEIYVNEIIKQLHEYDIDDYITWRGLGSIDCPISINRNQIDRIIRNARDKEIILYGDAKKHETQVLKELFNTLGIRIPYLIDDIESEYEWMGSNVKPVYDLLYEKRKYKVIVVSDKTGQLDRLDEMGLTINRDYIIYNTHANNLPRTFILDVQLGYNFHNQEVDDDMPGFQRLGRKGAYKIVLLGGSTTDGTLYPFKSWGEILYEKLNQNGYSVQIVNGGCAGYSSSQELIKLIRDVIPMRPDIVMDYTGVNDFVRSVENHPFISSYHKELFEAISRSVRFKENRNDFLNNMRNTEYTLGVPNNRPVWRQFVDNIRTMHSICLEFGIAYYAFLQPHLTLKREKYSAYEIKLERSSPRVNQEYIKEMDAFYENVRQEGKGCIEDITTLFDDVGDIYLDRCHVTEKGNEIIAQFMHDYLLKKEIVKI